ncbi:MAG TPA: DinB family protein [Candidatus Dormibacteraeota bacterium]|nr:DinB family protein [Candidatus Dormibacteraeota bacterium]
MKRDWTVAEIMAILRTTVDRVEELTATASSAELAPAGYDDDWSIAAVLAHLLACNDVLGGAMLRILAEDHPSWRASSPRAWQVKSGYHDRAFDTLFAAFRKGRAQLLEVLEVQAPEAWERTATVIVPPNRVDERSVRYYGEWLAQHEGTHVKDLGRRSKARTARVSLVGS